MQAQRTAAIDKPRRADVPESLQVLSGLAETGYIYACELPIDASRVSPGAAGISASERWARAIFEGAPRLVRWLIQFGWKAILGLRLAPKPTRLQVLGWNVVSANETTTVLAAESTMLICRLVIEARDGRILHATFVRFKRKPGRLLWAAAAPIHTRVIPYLLGSAAIREAL
jgi:Protein of unknown function (DUF2867)